ncbi:4a-hydroxytetrahydrobiopterin dehydratase [Deinococcus peraridilitoris]|uniref:4a-hydroxytetrahydrobiopterin dehydratase n=1 Tax=Deinococcus peraridilitoris (strain DSM 19664 / LMG 22246 / CIP 109416 / KR-200) TaxID=937777 RepID=K9ZVX8_DEIPD|nr:4a-hydroxytetrahydrobiopterin dehydratase [Deinococcus peraridilitoris]AFZ65783.1 pterin-4a-carbinolamine dehydratase [Deinococcus peraridilitoris DSM 19664]
MTLTHQEIQDQLPSGWTGSVSGISRDFTFESYEAGVAFAVHLALMAQRANHHPDTLTIGWKTVRVTYTTHSEGGVTGRDIAAARKVNTVIP